MKTTSKKKSKINIIHLDFEDELKKGSLFFRFSH